MLTGSPSGQLNSLDWKLVGYMTLMAIVGGVATAWLNVVPQIDFGKWTPVIAPIAVFLLTLAAQWAKNNKLEVPPGTVLMKLPDQPIPAQPPAAAPAPNGNPNPPAAQ